MPLTDVKVKLVGEDGNAWAIMGRVSSALKRAGHRDLAEKFTKEAMTGDYNHLLVTAMEYIVEDSCEDEEFNHGFNDVKFDDDEDDEYDFEEKE